MNRAVSLLLVGAGLFLALRRQPYDDLRGEVALITGGSRGLGLLLAREYARAGCKVAICARDEDELAQSQAILRQWGVEAFTVRCDVGSRTQVDTMIAAVIAHYGRIDILVNNAGAIRVGAFENMTERDFGQMLEVLFWGQLHTVMALLPDMKARGSGRIVNITSIGGKVPSPHLLPYTAAKFAANGFSAGLAAELRSSGIYVTTIPLGLTRTGAHLQAYFKGHKEEEFTWFSIGDNFPFLSMDAGDAAHEIVEATRRRAAERILTIPANVLARLYGLFPALTVKLLASTAPMLLPDPLPGDDTAEQGKTIKPRVQSPVFEALTTWGRTAAERLNNQR